MPQKTQAFGRQIVLWTCAGIGFNIAQRLLDHFIDLAVDSYAILAWLK